MSEDVNISGDNGGGLVRSITWKQGTLIVLGIPVLILPSLYDVSGILWAFSIIAWTVSVVQGFIQNAAFGELITTFPDAEGIPSATSRVLTPPNASRYHYKKFIAAFGAWGYWFAWTPAPAVFSILMANYLSDYFSFFGEMNFTILSVTIGVLVIGAFLLVNLRGLSKGASAGLVLAILSIVPMSIVLAATFFTGDFQISNISNGWLPPDWAWGPMDIVMLFGCLGLLQWSACAWEGVVIYGPEYKNPGSDVPKSLLACGFICLFLYFFMSTAVFGSLGVDGVEEAGTATLVPIAVMVFGEAGASLAVMLLVAGMLLIIQTGFLGGSRSLYSLARSGNMPRFFTKTTKNGAPIWCLLFAFAVNVALIFVGTPVAIIAGSGMGYCIGIAVALTAYYISKTNPRFKDLPRGWYAPRGWKYVALVMIFFQLLVLFPFLGYWNYTIYGIFPTMLGLFIILIYVPVWFIVQRYEGKDAA
ncbi:MAG: APC family permease [Candidatus Methanoplasma sp.]|jgi:amino acid transporter|nr:APC family permease [Candidatus Methanoplasma sp.]